MLLQRNQLPEVFLGQPWLSLQHFPSSSALLLQLQLSRACLLPPGIPMDCETLLIYTVVVHSGWTGFCNMFSLLAALCQVFLPAKEVHTVESCFEGLA